MYTECIIITKLIAYDSTSLLQGFNCFFQVSFVSFKKFLKCVVADMSLFLLIISRILVIKFQCHLPSCIIVY